MGKNYVCVFYETEAGEKPVENFIDSLNESSWDKFIYKKELLEQLGPELRFPHTTHIGDEIFELRFTGKEGRIRVCFFFSHRRQIVFLHGFVKKTKKIPKKEIDIARKRKLEIQ